jgi:hypothetical protein
VSDSHLQRGFDLPAVDAPEPGGPLLTRVREGAPDYAGAPAAGRAGISYSG